MAAGFPFSWASKGGAASCSPSFLDGHFEEGRIADQMPFKEYTCPFIGSRSDNGPLQTGSRAGTSRPAMQSFSHFICSASSLPGRASFQKARLLAGQFKLAVKRLLRHMYRMVHLRLYTAHSPVKGLALHGRMRRDVKFFGALLSGPGPCLLKKSRANAVPAQLL